MWYKDRDFPEVKSSNSDIVAVIENPKQLERVVREYNQLIDQAYCLSDQNFALLKENTKLKEALKSIALGAPDHFKLDERVEAGYLMNLAREALNSKSDCGNKE